MPDRLSDIAEAMLGAARKAGAEAADAIAMRGTSNEIEVKGGALEHAERAEGLDIGLRVLIGKRAAVVSGSDARPETLAAMAERAVAMARVAPEDPWIGLAAPEELSARRDGAGLDLLEPAPEPAPAALQDRALEAEAAALAVPGVSQVLKAVAGYGRTEIHLAATNGFSGGYARGSHSTYCVAIAGEGTGMERDSHGDSRVYLEDLESPEEIGRKAAEQVLERMGARRPPTGAFPVLYDERISSGLIGHLLAAINGRAVTRGESWLRSALGEQVLPAGLSLVEDPLRPRTAGSRPFDGEGLPVMPRDIVADGVLQGFTLDLAAARQLGMAPTGSARRGTQGGPGPGVSNVALTQGTQSREALIREMGRGLIVTSLIGSSINPNTGDYSRGVSGLWVENGEVAYPVNECTIAGNLREMLATIVPANDARPHLSHVVPSLLVEGLTIAGG